MDFCVFFAFPCTFECHHPGVPFTLESIGCPTFTTGGPVFGPLGAGGHLQLRGGEEGGKTATAPRESQLDSAIPGNVSFYKIRNITFSDDMMPNECQSLVQYFAETLEFLYYMYSIGETPKNK